MASISHDPGGRRRILFIGADGQRRAIRLGKMSQRSAVGVKLHIENLIVAKETGRPIETETQNWLADIGDTMISKLARVGLVQSRDSATLAQFVDAYIASRTEAETNTVRNWMNTRKKLTGFFGEDRDLRSIRPGDADDWRQWLVDKKLSDSTISKAVKHAKQFLKAAVRKRLADTNPFQELKAGGDGMTTVRFCVTRDDCQGAGGRPRRRMASYYRLGPIRGVAGSVRIARATVGRHRSRTRAIHSDQQEDETPRQRMEGSTAISRVQTILADAFDQAPPGSEYVISRYRGTNANLRAQLERILYRAKVDSWPRLFHNLRASRQTELENEFPSHVVCDWLGNSESVARKHYLQTTEDHFKEAAHKRRSTRPHPSLPIHTPTKKPRENPGLYVPVWNYTDVQVPPRGVEPLLPD